MCQPVDKIEQMFYTCLVRNNRRKRKIEKKEGGADRIYENR